MTTKGRGTIRFFSNTLKPDNERLNKLNSGDKIINFDEDLNDLSIIK
jgi:hypothetical protein